MLGPTSAAESELPFDIDTVLPTRDFDHHIGAKRANPAEYFTPTLEHDVVITERRQILAEHPERHIGMDEDAGDLLVSTIVWAKANSILPDDVIQKLDKEQSLQEKLAILACTWEPDFLLLGQNESQFFLRGGVVCFPSNWDFTQKINHPLEQIHQIVPRLNECIGKNIATFLAGMRDGISWQRVNWGMSSSPKKNNHPALGMPRLQASTPLDSVSFRVEEQLLQSLPSNGLLFGIHVRRTNLRNVLNNPKAAAGLNQALATMNEEMARYKGIADIRQTIIDDINEQPQKKLN